MSYVAPLIVIGTSLVAAFSIALEGTIVGATELCLMAACGVIELRQTVIHEREMRKFKGSDAFVIRHLRNLFETHGNDLGRTGRTRWPFVPGIEE